MESGAPPTELRTVIRQGKKVIKDTTGSYKRPSNSDSKEEIGWTTTMKT